MRCSWPPAGSDGCVCCARAHWPINASTPRTTTLHKQVALPSVVSHPACLVRPSKDRPSVLSTASRKCTTTHPNHHRKSARPTQFPPLQVLSSRVRGSMMHTACVLCIYYSMYALTSPSHPPATPQIYLYELMLRPYGVFLFLSCILDTH